MGSLKFQASASHAIPTTRRWSLNNFRKRASPARCSDFLPNISRNQKKNEDCWIPRVIGISTGDAGDYDAIVPIRTPPSVWEIVRKSDIRKQSPMYPRKFIADVQIGTVLPVLLSRAIFKNCGFPTFPLGDLLRGHRNPVNSRTTRGRTDTNHKNPLFLPHRPPTASHRPVIPPTSPTREPPQRRQKVGILNSLFLASKICTRKLSSSRRPITTANQHTGIDNPPV